MLATLSLIVLSHTAPAAGPQCVLSVGQRTEVARGPVSLSGYSAHGTDRNRYTLQRGDAAVSLLVIDQPSLASLTWRAPGAKTATMTCTQRSRRAGPAPAPLEQMVCALDQRVLRHGLSAMTWETPELTWTVHQQAQELRIGVSGPSVGFASAWREAQALGANALTLTAGGHELTCWRL